jgi:hypothetical protein
MRLVCIGARAIRPDIIATLNREINLSLMDLTARRRLAEVGTRRSDVACRVRRPRAETEKWAKAVIFRRQAE